MARPLTPEERERFSYMTLILDYFKIIHHRIALHSMSRTETPLSRRSDFQHLLPLIKEKKLDIFSLDPKSRLMFAKVCYYPELTAHFEGDLEFINGIKVLFEHNLENIHYIFVTNGIIMPALADKNKIWQHTAEYSGISEADLKKTVSTISFYENTFKPKVLHKINLKEIYLRNLVSQMRYITGEFTTSTMKCSNCGNTMLQGTFYIQYWDKKRAFPYYICPNCGVRNEPPENSDQIMHFVSGLS